MTDSNQKKSPVLNFEDKNYDINSLSDESKQLLKGLQVADAQIKMQEDTLKLLVLGRNGLVAQLKDKHKDVQHIENN